MNTRLGILFYSESIALKNLLFALMLVAVYSDSNGQVSDLARVEYTYIPQSNSDNRVSRFRALVNYPIQLNWEGSYLVIGLEYRKLDLEFEDPEPFALESLGDFRMFRTSLAFTYKMNETWRFAISAGAEANSNFDKSSLITDDLNFTGSIFLIKDKSGDDVEKPSRFLIGLNYSTNAGRPFPIPLINYYRKFQPNWSYSLGTPKTNIKHSLTKKQSIQAYITLDGFYSNIQRNLVVNYDDGSEATAENISMTLVLGGLGYEYNFTKNLIAYIYGGHTFFNEIRLRDRKRNNLFKINEENTFYLRGGIKFKI